MWSFFITFVFLIGASFAKEDLKVFRKCCLKEHSLVKVTGPEDTSAFSFRCINRTLKASDYSVNNYASDIVVAESVQVEYGVPDECNLEILQLSELDVQQSSDKNICYDRLVIEIVNGSVQNVIPRTIALKCNDTDIDAEVNLKVQNIRKCCPKGEVYDTEYHLCRKDEENVDTEWLTTYLKHQSADIYEFENGLNCKQEEYAVELEEGSKFDLLLQGSTLNVYNSEDKSTNELLKGNWCVERKFNTRRLVARVCTRDCSIFNAYCMRKCCPVGEHYRPFFCGRPASQCVPNTDDTVLFNISSHMNYLKKEYNVGGAVGIRSEIHCESGKISLNSSLPTDWYNLTRDGRLRSQLILTNDYCLEAFDFRACNSGVNVAAVLCFVKSLNQNPKNFEISFILNTISAICLAMTLLVYCSIPELRNLHGLNLICHVSTMLLAYSCLARVQHRLVVDRNLCAALGYGIYFGFVAAFAWLNVMCLDIWWTFGSVRTVQTLHKGRAERRRFLWYSLYAWGVSLAMTLLMYLLDKFPVTHVLDANMGDKMCWFGSVQNSESDWPHYIFFVIPMGLVSGVNFVLWVLTARHCARVKSEVHRLQAGSVGDRAKRRFRVDKAILTLTGKLWVVMGAGWISELVSTLLFEPNNKNMPWILLLVDMVNELQGVFIFIILVFKPKLYYLIRKRLGFSKTSSGPSMEKPTAQKNGTSSSGRTSSTFFSRTISTDERTNKRVSAPAENDKIH